MTNPTSEQWKQLYTAVMAVKKLAPWQWMLETDIFGVEDPLTGETYFVSVMGHLGEHLSIAVYMGAQAIHQFWDFSYIAHEAVIPQGLLEIYNLQASFEDRTELDKQDRAVMKELDLKFRGKQAYPLFRSYQPARAPWFLTADEARILTLALEQTLFVAPTLQEDPECFDNYDESHFLVRVLTDDGWQDEDRHIPPPTKITKLPQIDKASIQLLKQQKVTVTNLEVDLFMMLRAPIQEEKNIRPHFAYTLVALAPEFDQILFGDLLTSLPTIDAMYDKFPTELVQRLVRNKVRPAQITLQSQRLYNMLKPLETQLGIRIEFQSVLPAMNEIILQLLHFDSPF